MRKFILMMMLVMVPGMSFSAPVLDGHDQGNGGDGQVAEFMKLASVLGTYLATKKDPEINVVMFRDLVDKAKVESTSDPLSINGVPKDAINYPLLKKIVFSRARWSQISLEVKSQLVLHEFLGLMGIPDQDYSYTDSILLDFNYCSFTTPRLAFMITLERSLGDYCQGRPIQNLKMSVASARDKLGPAYFSSWSCRGKDFVGTLTPDMRTACILIRHDVREMEVVDFD